MAKRGLNQRAVAKGVGTAPSAISRWVNGETNPDTDSCAKLAQFFGEPLEKVYALAGHPADYAPPPRRTRSLQEHTLEFLADLPVVEIPIHDQGASAGLGQMVMEYAYWTPAQVAGRKIIGIRVHGKSMEPEYRDGDVVFVDKDVSAAVGNKVVATLGEEVFVKKLIQRKGKLFLQGNTGELAADEAKIEGTVIGFYREEV